MPPKKKMPFLAVRKGNIFEVTPSHLPELPSAGVGTFRRVNSIGVAEVSKGRSLHLSG
jgi:hypothetical protein